MLRLAILISVWVAIALGAAHAQAPRSKAVQSKAPERARVLLDTGRVRVSEVLIKPGARIDLPNQPDQFAYLLTDAVLVFSRPGRRPYELTFKSGEATLLPAQSTYAQNGGKNEVRAVLVEIKGAPARATKRITSKKGRKTLMLNVRGKGKRKK